MTVNKGRKEKKEERNLKQERHMAQGGTEVRDSGHLWPSDTRCGQEEAKEALGRVNKWWWPLLP